MNDPDAILLLWRVAAASLAVGIMTVLTQLLGWSMPRRPFLWASIGFMLVCVVMLVISLED